MLLKRFEPNDRAAFLTMCHDFYQGGAALSPIPDEQIDATFSKIVSGSPWIQGFLMYEGDALAGYAIVFPFYSNEAGGLCLMLEEIYVLPDFRGKGIGQQYLDSIAGQFDEPVVGMKLEVCPHNEKARALYERNGFRLLEYRSMVKGWPEQN